MMKNANLCNMRLYTFQNVHRKIKKINVIHICTNAYIKVKETRKHKIKEKDIFLDAISDARYP